MAAYFNTNQLRLTMKELVKIYMSDCEECNELSQDCMDLLRHNFQAEYAVYNKQTKAVEIGINKKTGKKLIKIDKRLFRPNEVHFLKGNINKAKKNLKWKPTISLNKLIEEMINFDLIKFKK